MSGRGKKAYQSKQVQNQQHQPPKRFPALHFDLPASPSQSEQPLRVGPPRSLNAVRQRAARPPPPAVVPPKSPIKPNMHHAGPPPPLKHAMQEAVPPIPPPSPIKQVKREASPPRQFSATKFKITAASYMQIIEAEEDRKHRLIDYSPSDGPSMRSPDAESSKSYFLLNTV